MSVKDMIKKSVLESGVFDQYNISSILVALVAALALGILIFLVYRRFYTGVIYSRTFAVTLVGMTVLTCMVTLAISTNVVISLGMVGALSIVRFRTAVKDPVKSEQESDVEELGFQIAKFIFDDCGDMTLASSEKKEREERFQNYIKAGSGKVSEKEAKEKVSGLVSGDWELFESSSKALTEGNTTLEKDDFIFERALDGIPVNYVREISLPVNEQALEWENEDGTLHEGQSEGWENEVLTMDFCSGTIQSFLHRNPIEASNVSDERLFLLPFDEVKDIFEKTITLQVMTEDKNRMIAVDGGSNYRYPSIDAQSAEITITKVQLGYMRMPDSEGSNTEAVLIPVWDFYGTWTSEEPEYKYGNGEDGLVMGDVTMDDAGVSLLTIDARDGSVIQRVQAGWAVSTGNN